MDFELICSSNMVTFSLMTTFNERASSSLNGCQQQGARNHV